MGDAKESEDVKEEVKEEAEDVDGEEKKEEEADPEAQKLGEEVFEQALDWAVTGKFERREEGRQMARETARGVVTRTLKKATISQTVLEFMQDEDEELWDSEEVADEDVDWNRMMCEESLHTANVRNKLLQRAYQLKDEAVILNIRNLLLQRKVAEISIARRTDKSKPQGLRAFSAIGVDPKVRYREALTRYGELRLALQDVSQRFLGELRVLREYRARVEQRLAHEEEQLLAVFKAEVAQLRCGLTGKAMQSEELLQPVQRKLAVMRKEHIRFVQTSQRLKDTERRIATLEEFGANVTLDDYEQLFDDNQKLEERIEERGEVVVALREKAVRELQEAAHMRDMMHGTEEDIEALVQQLEVVDERLSRGRDAVAKAKSRRDDIRRHTKKMVTDLELLAFPELLSHFQALRKLTTHAEAWLRSLVRACAEQEEGIRRVRSSLLELSKRYRGIIPDSVLRMLQLQSRGGQAWGAVGDSEMELETLPSRFTFSF